ncbi:hypothetical protein BXZ70DRAFT_1007808 [Cristinia sonorae]|uniref:F-box domain-containing protein n=1 Tax=Cristinia sonorae TaxID=1940300 RepID=A0A8K0XQA4_9AGAR|nr:hypothetical protein BXZ70DRAFT_1007808 [Cristinia sonorae]
MSLTIPVQETEDRHVSYCKNGIYDLPGEVAERIIVELHEHPHTISALAQTCRKHRFLIYQPGDTFLWREIYLSKYDDPRRAVYSQHPRSRSISHFDWGHEFRERIWAATYFCRASGDPCGVDLSPESDIQDLRALTAVLSLIDTALPISTCIADLRPEGKTYHEYWSSIPFQRANRLTPWEPASPDLTNNRSTNTMAFLDIVSRNFPATLLKRLDSPEITPEQDATPLSRALHRLAAYYHLISRTDASPAEPTVLAQGMPLLILHKRTYDLTLIKHSRMHGPFIPLSGATADDDPYVYPDDEYNFTVDWSHLSTIAPLMRRILESGADTWMPEYALGADALRPGAWIPPVETSASEGELNNSTSMEHDWAGVEGMWRRIETWLSHSVFEELNGPLWQKIPESQLSIRARHIVPCRLHISSYSQNPYFPSFPNIHFEGQTGMEQWYDIDSTDDNDETNVCYLDGKVSMLADGNVRWSFSMYLGRSKDTGRQWSFEGVQVGGIGSLVGAIGVWRGTNTMGFWWHWKVA